MCSNPKKYMLVNITKIILKHPDSSTVTFNIQGILLLKLPDGSIVMFRPRGSTLGFSSAGFTSPSYST